MLSLKNIITSTAALMALVQPCPAAFLKLIPEASSAAATAGAGVVTAGGIIAGDLINAFKGHHVMDTLGSHASQASQASQAAQGSQGLQGLQGSQGYQGLQGFGANQRLRRVQDSKQMEAVQAWWVCKDQLNSATIHFTAPAAHSVLVQGVPPACMKVIPVFGGQPGIRGGPVATGADSILFQNLTDDDVKEIQEALDNHASRKDKQIPAN